MLKLPPLKPFSCAVCSEPINGLQGLVLFFERANKYMAPTHGLIVHSSCDAFPGDKAYIVRSMPLADYLELLLGPRR